MQFGQSCLLMQYLGLAGKGYSYSSSSFHNHPIFSPKVHWKCDSVVMSYPWATFKILAQPNIFGEILLVNIEFNQNCQTACHSSCQQLFLMSDSCIFASIQIHIQIQIQNTYKSKRVIDPFSHICLMSDNYNLHQYKHK